MAAKYIVQKRTASGLETVAELPVLEDGKIDLSWLPVVGSMGSAIIESGSNANGYYTKFADGMLVCWNKPQSPTLGSYTIANASGNRYYSDLIQITPPSAFVNGCCATGSIWLAAGSSNGVSADISGHGSGNIYVRLWSNTAKNTATEYYVHYIAIGRWK